MSKQVIPIVLVLVFAAAVGVLAFKPGTADRDNRNDADPAQSRKPAEKTASGTDAASPARPAVQKPMFDGWTAPAVALLLTGEQHGYVEPCGCSANQLGGYSRRAGLIRQIEE